MGGWLETEVERKREGGIVREGNKSEIKAREHIDRCDVIPAVKIHFSGLFPSPGYAQIQSLRVFIH